MCRDIGKSVAVPAEIYTIDDFVEFGKSEIAVAIGSSQI